MGRKPVVWVALCVGLILCPLLTGCGVIPVGAAWPSVPITPLLQVNASKDQMHAYRVEASHSYDGGEGGLHNEYVLRELNITSGDWVLPQADIACDYFFLGYAPLRHHTMTVRLYRPGCQTVEVESWTLPHQVIWTGVGDLAGQEKAVDDLVSARMNKIWVPPDPSVTGYDESSALLFGSLAPGSKSPEHCKALLFAASEYERLAKGVADNPSAQTIRDRMMRKAAWLREHARRGVELTSDRKGGKEGAACHSE
jgi:hypothetical protein